MHTFPLIQNWHIRTPVLFRYLPGEFVDSFFESGALRLSSFARFSKHSNEQRFDPKEGNTFLTSRTTEGGGQTVTAWSRYGHNAYVLCASMYDDVALQEAFACDSCIRINDPTAFGAAIARHVPGFGEGLEGPCLYQKLKVIEKDVGHLEIEQTSSGHEPSQSDLPQKVLSKLQKIVTPEVYFLKESKYRHQQEYRILWFTSCSAKPYIDIECPEARQFCERFNVVTA